VIMASDSINVHEKAAWILHEAMRHRYFPTYPDEPYAFEVAKRAGGRQMRLRLFVSLLMLLTIFEVPVWCDASGLFHHRDSVERCTVKGRAPGDEVVMSGVPFLPIGVGVIFEFILLGWVVRELLHQKELDRAFGKQSSFGASQADLPLVITVVAITDACLFVLFPSVYGDYRLAPYLRFSLALASIETLTRLTKNFVHCMCSVAQIATFLLGSIVVFAWIAASIFDDVEGDDIYGDPINAGFESFGNSLYTSFLTSTGGNLPDVLVNSVVTHRAYIWLWLPYILLTSCVFSPVILAAVYGSFTSFATETAKGRISRRNKSLKQCWDLMITEGSPETVAETGQMAITSKEFQLVCDVLNDFRDLNFDMSVAPVMFEALDEDNSGRLAYQEFFNMCEMLEHNYQLTTRDSPCLPMCPTLKAWCDNGKDGPDLGYEDRYPRSKMDNIFNIVLALNTLFIVVESVYDLNDWEEPGLFLLLDSFFSFVYLLEVAVKLLVWSWGEYWASMDNRFDFVTSAILGGAGVALLRSRLTPDTLRNINILRLLRLLKALNNIPVYQATCQLIGRMVMACLDVLLMNVLVIYLWSALGTQFFGGMLYDSNPLLKGSDYLDSHFQVYNFNDMGMSFLTLFYFVLTGWVDQVATALIALAEPASITWFVTYGYFISFYIFGFMLAFNIWTAFSIDVFCKIQEISAGEREQSDVNLDDIRVTLADEGKCLHVGTSASLLYSKLSKTMFEVEDEEALHEDAGKPPDAEKTTTEFLGRLDQVATGFVSAKEALAKLEGRLALLESSADR